MKEKHLSPIAALLITKSGASGQNFGRALANQGYTVAYAHTAEQALREGQSLAPQLLVIDISEDKGFGMAILHSLRSDPHFARSQMVFIVPSGGVPSELSMNGSLKIVQILPKDCTIHAFLEAIGIALKIRGHCSHKQLAGRLRIVEMELEGKVARINPKGFELSAPARIAPATIFRLQSPALQKLGLDPCIFQKTSSESYFAKDNRFINEVTVTGISPEAALKIQKESQGR